MAKKAFLVLKGFFLGLANLIPGVSGGTLAVTLGIYEYIIEAINNLFKNFKENFNKLLPIVIGVALCFISMSKVITLALDKYQFQTIMFFVGLIIGGMPMLFKKVKKQYNFKNIIWFILSFALVILFVFLKEGNRVVDLTNMGIFDYALLIIVGMISSATMIIPGISGSFVMMLIGYYKPVVEALGDLTNFSHIGYNLSVLIPFGVGVLLGLFLIVKLIKLLLDKYEIKMYFGVIGFVLASIVGIVVAIEPFKVTFWSIAIAIITFAWGFFVTKALLNENK